MSAATLPRIIAGIPTHGYMGFAQHEAIHGTTPLPSRSGQDRTLEVEVARSGLRGRGGAGFPTAMKLHAVARAASGRAVVVANGCDGEPASSKDRVLLARLPHLVIDGALLAARAVGARDIVIAVSENKDRAEHAVEAALAERLALTRVGPHVRVAVVPHGYVSGQETALVNFLNGGPAKPTAVPPSVFERGVGGRPTLVQNAETLVQLALIARHGAAWFRELGTTEDPGSRLVSVTGAVAYPGVYEIENGAPLSGLLTAAGGATAPLQAFLLGGYAGTWVHPELGMQLALSDTELAKTGATLGAGIVVALPSWACAVAEVAYVTAWLAGQSAGQCGPCINGLAAIVATLQHLQRGTADGAAIERLQHWASLVRGRGACAHPDGVAGLVTSALELFAADFADHALHGACDACTRRRILPISDRRERRLAA